MQSCGGLRSAAETQFTLLAQSESEPNGASHQPIPANGTVTSSIFSEHTMSLSPPVSAIPRGALASSPPSMSCPRVLLKHPHTPQQLDPTTSLLRPRRSLAKSRIFCSRTLRLLTCSLCLLLNWGHQWYVQKVQSATCTNLNRNL